MKHRLFIVLYVIANLLILSVPFEYYDSYKNYLEFEPKYNIRCIDSGVLYTLHGDNQPQDLMPATMKEPKNMSVYEDWFRFGCAYHSERQPFLDGFNNAKTEAERIANTYAYHDFEASKPKITVNNFEYVEINKQRNFDFYYRFLIGPVLLMIGMWLVLQVLRIVYQRNSLGLFTWHPYSLAKAKPLSDKTKLGFSTSFEWAGESYKSSVLNAMGHVKYVSVVFLLITGPFLWLYGYLLWKIGLEGMLKISLVVGAVILIPLFLIGTQYTIKKKFQSISHWKISVVSFLGLLVGLLVTILWLVFSDIERKIVTTPNISAAWSLLHILGLIGFIYTIKLVGAQLNLVYTNYLKNKYTDPKSRTVDYADISLIVFLFRLIYPRVDTSKTLHKVILLIGWVITFATCGIGLLIYFSIIQRVIYYVIYGGDVSKWKIIKEFDIN